MGEFDAVDVFWAKLEKRLLEVSTELSSLEGVSVRIGRSSNANFPLRGYAEILPFELAVTVDLKEEGAGWSLSSDICTSEGEILAVGPSEAENWNGDKWMREFETFLGAELRKLVLSRASPKE